MLLGQAVIMDINKLFYETQSLPVGIRCGTVQVSGLIKVVNGFWGKIPSGG